MRYTAKIKAFTLIELLVVVAIISLLVSILVPSLDKARSLAQKTVCSLNMKNLGTGFAMFASDNNDLYPPGLTYFNCFVSNSWNKEILPWVLDVETYLSSGYGAGVCPADKEHACFSKLGASSGGYDEFFLMRFSSVPSSNQQAANLWPWSYATSYPLAQLHSKTVDGLFRCMLSINNLKHPEKTYLVTEAGRGTKSYSAWYTAIGYSPTDSPPSSRWMAGARHNEGRNFMFTDGHVEYVEEQDPNRPAYEAIDVYELDANF